LLLQENERAVSDDQIRAMPRRSVVVRSESEHRDRRFAMAKDTYSTD